METNEICCPKFDPTVYENKELMWAEKLFVKDTMRTFFHMPLPGQFGKTVVRMMAKIEAGDAKTTDADFLMLCADPTPWKSELFIHVTKEVPGAEHSHLSGTFLTKVYDGPYKEIRNWVKDMIAMVKKKNKALKTLYFYYTTCPKCAEKHGHNYVVGFAQVE